MPPPPSSAAWRLTARSCAGFTPPSPICCACPPRPIWRRPWVRRRWGRCPGVCLRPSPCIVSRPTAIWNSTPGRSPWRSPSTRISNWPSATRTGKTTRCASCPGPLVRPCACTWVSTSDPPAPSWPWSTTRTSWWWTSTARPAAIRWVPPRSYAGPCASWNKRRARASRCWVRAPRAAAARSWARSSGPTPSSMRSAPMWRAPPTPIPKWTPSSRSAARTPSTCTSWTVTSATPT